MYEEAERDLEGFWSRQAGELVDWFAELRARSSTSPTPFYKWFADGKLNASYNCLDRHIESGNGDRVAYHWRGEEGEEREITYAELHRDVQRFANALKTVGSARATSSGSSCRWSPRSPSRCSPAPESAPPTTSSSAASPRRGARADGVLRGKGPGDHRRRRRKGKTGPDQERRRREDRGPLPRSRPSSSSATPASPAR